MSTFVLKGKPPIKLLDLLKKKKLTLNTFLKDTGVVTYQKLQEKCAKLGVSSPTEEEFKAIFPERVSSPQEGIVVLDPPVLTKDTGEKVSVDIFFANVQEPLEGSGTEEKPLEIIDSEEETPPIVQEMSIKRSKKNKKQ